MVSFGGKLLPTASYIFKVNLLPECQSRAFPAILEVFNQFLSFSYQVVTFLVLAIEDADAIKPILKKVFPKMVLKQFDSSSSV